MFELSHGDAWSMTGGRPVLAQCLSMLAADKMGSCVCLPGRRMLSITACLSAEVAATLPPPPHASFRCCRIFSVLAYGSSSAAVSTASLDAGSTGSCSLPPDVVRELFIRLLLLSPQLASAELKGLVMQVLLHLVATGKQLWCLLCLILSCFITCIT